MPTFLQLAPNQGGQRFGPFQGQIRLGTHGGQCQVTVQSPGIQPVHAIVTDHNNGSFTLQPSEPQVRLFMRQAATGQVWPVQAPVAAANGDAIILGAENGPSFTLQYQAGAPAAGIQGPAGNRGGARGGGGGGMASGLAREAQRQWVSRLIARNYTARAIHQWYYRYRTGSLSNPRVLLPLITTVLGGLAMAVMSCMGLAAAGVGMLFK